MLLQEDGAFRADKHKPLGVQRPYASCKPIGICCKKPSYNAKNAYSVSWSFPEAILHWLHLLAMMVADSVTCSRTLAGFCFFLQHKGLIVYLWLINSLPTQTSSLLPHRGSTLSSTFVLVIPTNEDHRNQRLEDGRMK